jgi:hypothetical protein
MQIYSREYTTAGDHTWDVPLGVEWVWVNAVAGGGGGGSSTAGFDWGCGGGGGGEDCNGVQISYPVGTLAITVGRGGTNLITMKVVRGARSIEQRSPAGGVAAGDQGGDTTVGPIRLCGGFGGTGAAGHGGCGGGSWGGHGNDSGYGGNQGNQVASKGIDGFASSRKNAAKFFSGAGGGAGSETAGGSGDGMRPVGGWNAGTGATQGAGGAILWSRRAAGIRAPMGTR